MSNTTELEGEQMPVLMSHSERKEHQECPQSVPMVWLDDGWARYQHSQTLKQLKERGGLGPTEIWANIERKSIFKTPNQSDCIKYLIDKLAKP